MQLDWGHSLLGNPAELHLGSGPHQSPPFTLSCSSALLLLPQFTADSTTHLTSWLLIHQPKVSVLWKVERASGSLKCLSLRRSTALHSRKGVEAPGGEGSHESEAEPAQELRGPDSCPEHSTTRA